MSDREFVRIGLRILDEQLVDCAGRRCGRIEDLELDAELGQPARIVGILCGATAWKRRLPPRFSELIAGDPRNLKRVGWEHVAEMHNEIHLSLPEDELARAGGDSGRAPLAISQLMGMPLAAGGEKPRTVHDVIASRPSASDPGTPWELEGLLVGRRGWLQRIGFSPLLGKEMAEGKTPENFVAWQRARLDDDGGRIIVSR
jgi:hypothetical protein